MPAQSPPDSWDRRLSRSLFSLAAEYITGRMGTSAGSPRVALVTGSGKKRLGWHVADALARRGYALAIHYRSSQAEAERTVAEFASRGVQAAAFGADLADERAVRGMVEQVLARFERIDVLV